MDLTGNDLGPRSVRAAASRACAVRKNGAGQHPSARTPVTLSHTYASAYEERLAWVW